MPLVDGVRPTARVRPGVAGRGWPSGWPASASPWRSAQRSWRFIDFAVLAVLRGGQARRFPEVRALRAPHEGGAGLTLLAGGRWRCPWRCPPPHTPRRCAHLRPPCFGGGRASTPRRSTLSARRASDLAGKSVPVMAAASWWRRAAPSPKRRSARHGGVARRAHTHRDPPLACLPRWRRSVAPWVTHASPCYALLRPACGRRLYGDGRGGRVIAWRRGRGPWR